MTSTMPPISSRKTGSPVGLGLGVGLGLRLRSRLRSRLGLGFGFGFGYGLGLGLGLVREDDGRAYALRHTLADVPREGGVRVRLS